MPGEIAQDASDSEQSGYHGISCHLVFGNHGSGSTFCISQRERVGLVRSVVVPRIVAREEELKRIHDLFVELGFEKGDAWSDNRSSGLPMLAPLGAVEFYHGQPPAPADVIVEVEDVERAIEAVQRHGMRIVADKSRTHWGADLFVALIGGCHFAFFRWAEQQTGSPELKAA